NLDQLGETVAAGNDDLMPRLRVAGVFGNADRQRGSQRLEFHAVNKFLASTAQVIGDAKDVFAVGGNVEAEIAVGTAGIVVARDSFAGAVIQVHDRVERRTHSASVTADLEHLSLLRLESETV